MGQEQNKYHVSKDGKVFRVNDDGSFTEIGNVNDLFENEGDNKLTPKKNNKKSPTNNTVTNIVLIIILLAIPIAVTGLLCYNNTVSEHISVDTIDVSDTIDIDSITYITSDIKSLSNKRTYADKTNDKSNYLDNVTKPKLETTIQSRGTPQKYNTLTWDECDSSPSLHKDDDESNNEIIRIHTEDQIGSVVESSPSKCKIISVEIEVERSVSVHTIHGQVR